jgi:hypothetical protein
MIPITQTELDELCVESQYALTVLIDDFIDQYQRSDIFLKRPAAQLLDLNCLMLSIQDYRSAAKTSSVERACLCQTAQNMHGVLMFQIALS